MALFIVLSVFSGLEEYTKSFANVLDPDYVALPKTGKFVSLTPENLNAIQSIAGIESVSEIIEERIVFTYADKQTVAYLKAVPEGYERNTKILEYTENGRWCEPGTAYAVIGKGLMYALGISQYSESAVLEGLAMKPGEGFFTSPDDAYIRVPLYAVDVYSFNNVDTDSKYIYTPLEIGQTLLSWPEDRYTKLELLFTNESSANEVIKEIETLFPNTFEFKSRAQLNDGLYQMLQMESLAVYLIFTLIIIITLFCLCGALIMMILEKRKNIKTLSHIGFTIQQIRKIFFTQGMIITIGGSLLGLFLGLIVAYSQYKWQFIKINEDFAYPVIINFENAYTVLLTVFLLGSLACLLASSRINKKFINIS